jgi:hypothetical protein
MKKSIITAIGITCCAGSVYAAGPQGGVPGPRPDVLSLGSVAPSQVFLSSAAAPAPIQALPSPESKLDLGRIAYKISYLGSLILTADRIVRSVDSVLDGMQVTCHDGTSVKLLMEPGSKGFDVMVQMSRPLEF